jgi:prepilin-type N-terminal cleavage/methylation domain-containing protein
MKNTLSHGFSLIEVLLVMGLFTIIIGVSFPVYQQTQNHNAAILAANAIEQSVHRAVMLARSGQQDGSWGVRVASGAVTLFYGETYATRDTDYDEIYTIPSTITFSATPEMVFEKYTGFTDSPQSITVSSPSGGGVTLSILTSGVVNR